MKVYSPHRWPAEWELQQSTWLSWPHNVATWPGRFEQIPAVFERLVHELAQVQPVEILSGPPNYRCALLDGVRHWNNVRVHTVATDDSWIRDYGPTFVKHVSDGSLVGVDWRYNAWGGKYLPYDNDAAVTEWICRSLRSMRSSSSLHCEGGAIEGNGQGVALTTTKCLTSPTRNPGWPRRLIENELRAQLGVETVVWVDGGGLAGDDTDGHIDQLARFVNANTLVAATSSDRTDPNALGLDENVRQLRAVSLPTGERFNVVTLPTPPPRFIDQQRVPESYCNFVFANGIIIVPTFRSESTDLQAIETLTRLMPERRIIPLDAYDLSWGLGAFHCVTQQQPHAQS